MRWIAWALAFAASVSLAAAPVGCGRTGARLQAGIEHYEKGAYEGALIRLRDVGPEETRLRTKQRVRYLAYRGLAHFHTGQLEDARRFLAEAQAALAEEDADPKWLPHDIREEMASVSTKLGLAAERPPAGSAPPLAPSPGDAPPAGSAEPPVPPPTDSAAPAAPPPSDAPAPPPSVGSPAGSAPGAPIPPAAAPPPADKL